MSFRLSYPVSMRDNETKERSLTHPRPVHIVGCQHRYLFLPTPMVSHYILPKLGFSTYLIRSTTAWVVSAGLDVNPS